MFQFFVENKLFAPVATFFAALLAFSAVFVNQRFMGKRLEKEIESKERLQKEEQILKQSQELNRAKIEKLEELFSNLQEYKSSILYNLEYNSVDIFSDDINQKELMEYYQDFELLIVRLKSNRLRTDLIVKMYFPHISLNMREFEILEVSLIGAIKDAYHAVSLNSQYREVFSTIAKLPERAKSLVEYIDILEGKVVGESANLQQV
ncbi:hypothetical protein [Aliivibrio wodanis]|uniref:hypothetical protein n=1 Tax=Aliivibrio wodanis TaxID=80852 RepID=UPI00406D0809